MLYDHKPLAAREGRDNQSGKKPGVTGARWLDGRHQGGRNIGGRGGRCVGQSHRHPPAMCQKLLIKEKHSDTVTERRQVENAKLKRTIRHVH